MKINKKILTVIIFSLILMLISSLLVTGCGRRARIAAAIKKQRQEESQEQTTAQQTQVEATQDSETQQKDETTPDTEAVQDTTTQTEPQEEIEEQETDTAETTQEEIVEETSPEEETVEETTEEIEEDTTEETEEEQQEISADMPVVPGESAVIASGDFLDYPFIFVGEDTDGIGQARGFISFDISQLAGATINKAKVSGTANIISGTPFQCYGPIIVKAVYWGQREPGPSDFDLDGVEVLNFQKKNFGLSSEPLKNDLQNVVNSGIQRYQLVFYFEIDQANDDGEQDSITYDLDEIKLTVTYIP